jgi:hypothetical protein
VWAVGQTEDPGQLTLIEHWNGKAWRQVTSPNPGSNNKLNDVSPSWAVGSYNSSGTKTLVLRRVGNSWAQVTSPNPETNLNELQGVVQISPGNAWAAGYVLNGTAYRTLILHWNGTAWKRVQSPNTGDASTDNMLFGSRHTAPTTSGRSASERKAWHSTTDAALERREVEDRRRSDSRRRAVRLLPRGRENRLDARLGDRLLRGRKL